MPVQVRHPISCSKSIGKDSRNFTATGSWGASSEFSGASGRSADPAANLRFWNRFRDRLDLVGQRPTRDDLTWKTAGSTCRARARAVPGMKEVAEHAGVALSSVSRVLSGHPDVSEPMRRRVMAAVDELDYSPDLLAQGLRSRTTYSVGFVVANISNPVLAGAVQGAERRLRAAGYSLLLTDSGGRSVPRCRPDPAAAETPGRRPAAVPRR